ncbi:right-handed parallel beta-helix repeat-containing protein [Thalassotalea psychrophila]|uniref:Right-handed parallel beta-helix repeat-containing protein n=1 Tax=Thalassotalea psychrophila TaxID=3065647 RepID=A0ABY9TWZ8_9GAMM|nr:right-handed parallel beta-helix repeat-containing protein [Colwelliaceae bacterium SQ149]
MKHFKIIILLITSSLVLSACGFSGNSAENADMSSRAIKAITYYVSPMGNNTNLGTSPEKPFKAVQHAVNQMSSGDTLIVLDGLYTGTLTLKSGITVRAQSPRKAIFSGVEQLNVTFEHHASGVYKAKIEQKVSQLFFDNQPMSWAQWPNTQWSENWIEDKKWASATDGTGPGVLTSEEFESIKSLNLTGSYAFIRYGKGNSNYSRRIESFDGKVLHWNDDNFYNKKYTGEDGRRGSVQALKTMSKDHIWHPNKSKFFLAGSLDLLDAPGEWVVDGDLLYLYPLDGKDPNKAKLLSKTQDYCINQSNTLMDVTISGIDFFACSLKLDNEDNTNIALRNTHFSYIGGELLFPDRVSSARLNKPIELVGKDILIEKSLFAGAQNTALTIAGENLTVRNSVFMENNRHANFESRSVIVLPTGRYDIINNTFFNNHSDAISIKSKVKGTPSVSPQVSYNNIFNSGKYNSDVSGIYMPLGSQAFADVHHNWIHNINGNAFRLDLAGSQLNLHHNVFWASKRGINVEGYGEFNIYNNTDVLNHTASLLTRNVLNHGRQTKASLDKTFPPIDDWNVINNLSEGLDDRVGPREKALYRAQFKKGKVYAERTKNSNMAIVDRGSIQGNLTGKRRELFINSELSALDLMPIDSRVQGGVVQTDELVAQGVTSLGSYRGAYDYKEAGWTAGSDWMPYGLDVIKTVAASEQFAKKYNMVSIVPEINTVALEQGELSKSVTPNN